MNQIHWISGPQNIGIGDFANLNIPDGDRFTDARGARVILENANMPVPSGVIGVLADSAGTWWAVLQYDKCGYVKSAGLTQIDAPTVLKAVKKQFQRENGNGISFLTWQSQPIFDAQADTVTWAAQVKSGSAKTLNESVVLLGRYGILRVTDVRSFPPGSAPSLEELVSNNLSFKVGHSYSDHQNGDKLAQIGLVGLIAGESSRPVVSGTGTWVYWIYAGLIVCVAFAGIMTLASRKKARHRRANAPLSAAAAPKAAVAVQTAPIAPKVDRPVALTNVKLNGHSRTNGSTVEKNGKQSHRARRKRVFDYSKFYTHVMNELSFHAYEASPLAANGRGRNGKVNGHTNGVNGHSNGTNGANGSGPSDPVKSGIAELIATQKALIQEQKCLLEQQTRLIEEKRWLIEEQSAFIKGQAAIGNDQQFPLKFE
ncbi:MAG: DUF2167 domain-containing protein [Limisphaerales bacterium]